MNEGTPERQPGSTAQSSPRTKASAWALWLAAALAGALVISCSERAATCATERDCGPGWTCSVGECRKLCLQHDDCWPPAIGCLNGVCVPVLPQACTNNTDCQELPSADACSADHTCVCTAIGLPCLTGQRCTAGGCVDPASAAPSFGVCAGGLDGESANYHLQLFVAPASPVGTGESTNYRLRLGPAR